MNFNVPQFIEVEDKIAFQMTAKQLAWYAAGGAILFILWRFVDNKIVFIGIAIVVVLICTGFAFYKPAGMTLIGFILGGFGFLVKPKVMIWQRKIGDENMAVKKKKKQEKKSILKKGGSKFLKEKALQDTNTLADILDKQSKL